jgi:hypothetical protein
MQIVPVFTSTIFLALTFQRATAHHLFCAIPGTDTNCPGFVQIAAASRLKAYNPPTNASSDYPACFETLSGLASF